MIGGLLKSASCAALLVAAGLFAASAPAGAAAVVAHWSGRVRFAVAMTAAIAAACVAGLGLVSLFAQRRLRARRTAIVNEGPS